MIAAHSSAAGSMELLSLAKSGLQDWTVAPSGLALRTANRASALRPIVPESAQTPKLQAASCPQMRPVRFRPKLLFSISSLAPHPWIWLFAAELRNECEEVPVPGTRAGTNQQILVRGRLWTAQSKRLETLSSLLIRRMASPSRGAIEMRLILTHLRTSSVAAIESVTTIDFSFDA